MKKGFLLLVIAIFMTARGDAADDICKPSETKEQCDDFVKAWIDAPEKGAAKANTGVSSVASPAQSTTKDFLSMLAAALAVPMTGDGARQMTLETNLPLLHGHRLKLQTVLVKPELSADLKQRLGGNTAALTDVQHSLSNVDDVSVSASLDAATQRVGRSLNPHRQAYDTMLRALPSENRGKAAETFASQFAFLLNHQPQIYGTALYRQRENVAGPNERSARLTYEMGFRNLNAFFKNNGDCRIVQKANAESCGEKLRAFAGEQATADDPADRVSMSVEYRTSDGVSVALPQYKVNFHATNAHSFVYTLAYGRNSMFMKKDRVDVSVNYEDTTVSAATDIVAATAAGGIAPFAEAAATTGAKAVRDRFVASATYSYKINDMMSMPFSLIYANHASYLGDVGRKLNAHFGISVKMNP